MRPQSDPQFTPLAQKLRKSMTKAERHLWYDFLRTLPVTVNRKKVIGEFIADFYCASANLVIDVSPLNLSYDPNGAKERRLYFDSLNLTYLYFSEDAVLHYFDAVCAEILRYIA